MSNQTSSAQSGQSQKLDWEGLSKLLTALGPLVGTGLLYIIGWVYISNWYGYFGINPSQLSISLPQVLIRSISPLIITIVTIGAGVVCYYVFSRISGFILAHELWFIFFTSLLFNLLISLYISPSQYILRIIYLSLAIIAVGIVLYYILNGEWARKVGSIILKNLRWFMIGGCLLLLLLLYVYFPGGLTVGGIAAGSFIVALLLFPTITLYLELFINSIRKVFDFKTLLENFTHINRNVRMGIFCLLYLYSILVLSTSLALYNATQGKIGVLENQSIQKVLLIGPRLLNSMPDLEKYCNNEICIYGPFGLIAENENSYFFINWGANTQQQKTLFPTNAALYIIPRSNQNGSYSIMPDSISIPSPTPTPTDTSMPISTETQTPQPTFTATLTPQPTITLTLTLTH